MVSLGKSQSERERRSASAKAEKQQLATNYKFGLLYCKKGQTQEVRRKRE